MKKIVLIPILLFLLSCGNETNRSLQFSIHQTVEIPITFVTITVLVSEFGTDAVAVEQRGYDHLTKVVQLLRHNGISDEQLTIEAGEVTMSPYRTDQPYEYRATVVYDMHDLERIDTARRALIEAGASSFLVSGYGNSGEQDIYQEAYKNAIQQARERADALLSGQNVRTGSILHIHESYSEVFTERADAAVSFATTQQRDGLNLRPSLFQKTYYTKPIHFQITFALEDF